MLKLFTLEQPSIDSPFQRGLVNRLMGTKTGFFCISELPIDPPAQSIDSCSTKWGFSW
jgi:hypothetical protein